MALGVELPSSLKACLLRSCVIDEKLPPLRLALASCSSQLFFTGYDLRRRGPADGNCSSVVRTVSARAWDDRN